jgi:Nuclease-related domain
MNTNSSVEVFLGNPIVEQSEQHMLARLQGDLNRLGIDARGLANVSLGGGLSQVDFVILTEQRVTLVEQKTYSGPVVAGPENGPWEVQVGEATVLERGNGFSQALRGAHKLSDALHRFAHRHGAPPPTRGKYLKDLDTVICLYPTIQVGSSIAEHRHVAVVGYEELLDRIQTVGPRPLWSGADWDAFCREQNLYRAEDDSPASAKRLAGAAAVDEYRGRFLTAQSDLAPLVETRVCVNDQLVDRPDVVAELTRGSTVSLVGASEMGKSLWAQWLAAELARAGSVPIWLPAEVCEPELLRSTTRAIAPYTKLNARELLAAADAAGRPVVFIIDDLTRADAKVRNALLRGVNASRVRNAPRGLLTTSQTVHSIPGDTDTLTIEVVAPDQSERRMVLAAYGAETLLDRCDALTSPLELAVAAACADGLSPDAGVSQLLDRYVDQLVGGDDRTRHALRSVAMRMHQTIRPALPRPDVARALHRELDLDDAALRDVFDCRLISVAHGKVAFRHERFEHFLAAEAIMMGAVDVEGLARALNAPQALHIRNDAIALHSDKADLAQLMSSCVHTDTIVAAALGQLGLAAAVAAEAALSQALSDACAQTTAPGHLLRLNGMDATWEPADGLPRAQRARLSAIGQLLLDGWNVDRVGQLLDFTDALCENTVANTDASLDRGLITNLVYASTYILGPGKLPASVVVQAAVHASWNAAEHQGVVEQLLAGAENDALGGRFYLAAQLFKRNARPELAAHVAVRALRSGHYHLHLLGLDLAERFAHQLTGDDREQVVAAARALFEENNVILNGAIVETLEEFGEIEPSRSLDDVNDELHRILSLDDTDLAQKLAYSAYSNQFETVAIGPYFEAIRALDATDGRRLRALALLGAPEYSLYTEIILAELEELGGMEDPAGAAAVCTFVARTAPGEWMDPRSTMAAVCMGLGLLARAGQPLPAPAVQGADDPAWRALLTAILGVLADEHGDQADPDATASAWAALAGEHRHTLASALAAVYHVHRFTKAPDVHQLLIDAMPPEALDALIWSIEHPAQLRSLLWHDRGDVSYLIDLLGRIGDHRAADALRRLAEESAAAPEAIEAVRQIEMRAAS